MKSLYSIFSFVIIQLICNDGFAQDVHFSMFDMSPLNLNPAHTGLMEGDKRIANIYRTQWKAIDDPLNTFSISYDQHLYFLPKNISAGIVFVSDKSGGINLIENKFLLSSAIQLFQRSNTFSLGIQVGYVSKIWNLSGVTFPQQYNREIGQFDSFLSSGENNLKLGTGYMDINAGAIWKRPTPKGTILMGVSTFHANSPDDSFYKNGYGLKPRLVVHGYYDFKLNTKWFIKPSMMLMTMQKAQDLLLTTSAGVTVKENPLNIKRTWFGVGVRTGINRNGDSAIPTIGIDFKHFDVAAAYDINFSELNLATNNRGAFEIALIYTSRSTAINKIIIPCDRF